MLQGSNIPILKGPAPFRYPAGFLLVCNSNTKLGLLFYITMNQII